MFVVPVCHDSLAGQLRQPTARRGCQCACATHRTWRTATGWHRCCLLLQFSNRSRTINANRLRLKLSPLILAHILLGQRQHLLVLTRQLALQLLVGGVLGEEWGEGGGGGGEEVVGVLALEAEEDVRGGGEDDEEEDEGDEESEIGRRQEGEARDGRRRRWVVDGAACWVWCWW